MTDQYKLVHNKNAHGYTSKILKDGMPIEIEIIGTYRSKYDINSFNGKAIDSLKLTINNYRHRLYNEALCNKIDKSFCDAMDTCDEIMSFINEQMKSDPILKGKRNISVPFRTEVKNIETKDVLRFVSSGVNTDRSVGKLEDNKVRTTIVVQHDNNIKEILDVDRGQLNNILNNKTFTAIFRMKFGLFVPKIGTNVYITLKAQTIFLKYIHTDVIGSIERNDEDKQRLLKESASMFDDISKDMTVDTDDLAK